MSAAIDEIRAHHRTRNYAMEQRKRADLSLLAFIRMHLGWRKDAPEAERKRIADQAKALRAIGEKIAAGKPVETDDPDWHDLAPVILASLAARAPFDAVEKNATKQMEALAKALPVWGWAEAVRGFGPVSLAVIVGEAGDLSDYPKKGHLWKRMGLAVIDGVRQGGLKKSASAENWIAHGYNATRRSKMFVIGDCLVKQGEFYREVYLARKEYERARAAEAGLTVAPAAKIPKARAGEFISDGHIARRSQRYMEKKLVRDLWQAWRVNGGQE